MRIIIIILLTSINVLAIADTECSVSNDAQAVSDRFAQLAYKPIYVDGKLAYGPKSVTEAERKEAVACLKKAIDMGVWRNAYTLSSYYKTGNERLGIKKDEGLAQYYHGRFLGGQMLEKIKSNSLSRRVKPEKYEAFVENLAVKNGCTETAVSNVEKTGQYYREYEVSCDSKMLAFKCEFDKPTPCYLK